MEHGAPQVGRRGQMKVRPRAYTSTHGRTAPREFGTPATEKSSPFPMCATDPTAVRYQSYMGTGGSGGAAISGAGGGTAGAVPAPFPPKTFGAISFK